MTKIYGFTSADDIEDLRYLNREYGPRAKLNRMPSAPRWPRGADGEGGLATFWVGGIAYFKDSAGAQTDNLFTNWNVTNRSCKCYRYKASLSVCDLPDDGSDDADFGNAIDVHFAYFSGVPAFGDTVSAIKIDGNWQAVGGRLMPGLGYLDDEIDPDELPLPERYRIIIPADFIHNQIEACGTGEDWAVYARVACTPSITVPTNRAMSLVCVPKQGADLGVEWYASPLCCDWSLT